MGGTGRGDTIGALNAPSRGFAHTSGDDVLAHTAPSTSTLSIEVEPITGETLASDLPMLKLVTFGFPEELMHGERQKFGLARNVRLLKAVSRARLYSFLRGNVSAETAAKDIYVCQLACDETNERRRAFLETVDQFRIHSVVDRDYLEGHAREYADTYDHVSDDVLRELEVERELLEKNIQNHLLYDEIYRPLEELADTYMPSVAEAVAHAALDVQAVVHPLDQFVDDDVPTITTPQITTEFFLERFEQARSELERIDRRRSPSDLDRDALRHRLLRKLPPKETGQYHPKPLRNLPLLDRPRETSGADETLQEGKQRMDDAESLVDRILNGAFRVVGNLGGVIYPIENGDRNALVNPWVADTPVGETPYQILWQREFFGDHVVTTLWEALKSETLTERVAINCPMCKISPQQRCGEGLVCTSSGLLEQLNDRLPPLTRELWRIRERYVIEAAR